MNPTIPIKNPYSAALVGLTMDATDAEFALRWQRRFPDQGIRTNAAGSFGSPGTTTAAKSESSAQAGETAFLGEVSKLRARGFSYQQAWQIALTTPPGQDFFDTWKREAEAGKVAQLPNSESSQSRKSKECARKFQLLLHSRAMKFPNESYEARFAAVANSVAGEQMLSRMKRAEQIAFANEPDRGQRSLAGDWNPEFKTKMRDAIKQEATPTVERHNPQLEQQSKKEFHDLVARLALESGVNESGVSLWARDHHPEARKLWQTYQHQKFLGKKQNLATQQGSSSP